MPEKSVDIYRKSRIMYIIEAALEYFISISVSGAFFATLTTYLGISDSTTGLLISFTSLGFCFQIIALLIPNRRSSKKLVVSGHLLEQLLFTLLYVVSFFNISSNAKSALIVIFMLGGRIWANIVYSPKIAWLMGLVDEHKRGKFSATKEMISLVSGMLFTLVMGRIVDIYKEKNDIKTAFIICAVTMFVLTVSHSITLILTKERPEEKSEKIGTVKSQILNLFKCKNFWLILPVLMLWSIASYASTPFYSTYLISELAFDLFVISLIGIVGSGARTVFSLPMGAFADKNGFSKMLLICFVLMLAAFGMMIFARPETRYIYIGYMIMHSIGMAGINSSEINLVLDYTSRTLRVGALAIKGLICGFTGFFTTLAVTPLVDYIQKNGNRIFGIQIYAQQATSIISTIACILALVYMLTVVRKLKREN